MSSPADKQTFDADKPFKPWCDEVYVALCQRYPDANGEFEKTQVVEMLQEVKDVDLRTGSLFYDTIWKRYYK